MASLPKSATGIVAHQVPNGQQNTVVRPGDPLGVRSASSSPLFPCSSSSMSSSRDSSPTKLLSGDLEPEMLARMKWPLSGMAARQRRRWRKPRRRPNQNDSELKQHTKRAPICAQSSSSSLLSLLSSSSGIGSSIGTETPPPGSVESAEECHHHQQNGPIEARPVECRPKAVGQQQPTFGIAPTAPSAPLLLDLSNPALQQFYLQQRAFFRQIYAQQLAALSARLGLMPPPSRGHSGRRGQVNYGMEAPHQHLGFPPAPPPPGPLLNFLVNQQPPTQNEGPVGYGMAMGRDMMTSDQGEKTLQNHDTSSAKIIKGNEDDRIQHLPFTAGPYGDISCMDVLSECIYYLRQNDYDHIQKDYQLRRKLNLRDKLYYQLTPVFHPCALYIVGSSVNGFGTSNSDLDLCLMLTHQDVDQMTMLETVKETLKNFPLVTEQHLIAAKVPILRIKCGGAFSDILVDLNVNNSVAIRNTHLMCYYSGFDWRVRPIVMVVKEWAKRRGINNASRSTFTSYSLVLMVIHYLQCGADPPVLPSLQKLYPRHFSDRNDVRQLNVSHQLDPLPSTIWNFDQRLSLSDLLLGFLRYYAFEFNFDTDAISIREGKKLKRAQVAQNQSPFNTLSQWHCICIEEPFTLSNAAHSVYDERIFQEIKKAFADSYHELDKNRDLDSFLGKPADEENGKEEEEPENGIAADDEQPQQQPSPAVSPLQCSNDNQTRTSNSIH